MDKADTASATTALVPRETIEDIVRFRDQAMELYADAHAAIVVAAAKIKAANEMAQRCHPGVNSYTYSSIEEVKAFGKAVRLPEREQYLRVARRLTEIGAWAWIVERTDLERLMDKEAKDQLHQQMAYVPDRVDREGQLITGEEVERGMPPLTVENVYATLETFRLDAGKIFKRGIANAFSKLDRRFRSHDGFKVGSRIILDRAFNESGSWCYNGRHRDTLMDIERTFSILANQSVKHSYGGSIGAIDNARRHVHNPAQTTVHTQFFKVEIYKNGNAHLWFTRKELVVQVNKILAEWYGEVIGDAEQQQEDIFKRVKTTPAKRYGFYPCSDDVVARVLDHVPLYCEAGAPPLRILEPSAGTGMLARPLAAERTSWEGGYGKDRVERTYKNQVDCVEIQPELARALEAEGIYRKVWCRDFISMKPDPKALYDVVAMNPPFDGERDIDHVVHAMKFLKPDGYLVAVMSAGTEFRETKKARAFRELMKKMKARFQDLPAGSFSHCGTNVNTLTVRFFNDGRSFYH